MNRDFKKWLSTMKDSIATWTYYTDFIKVYENVNSIKLELYLLNSLINSKNIEKEFINIVEKYPTVMKVIPILLAKRTEEIKVNDVDENFVFNFVDVNYTPEQYALFMRNSGLFDLLENHLINNLFDYVMGIEVGMDTNSRKNRTGTVMEDLVESYLIKAGLVKNKTYFKEMKLSDVEKQFNLNLSSLSNEGTTEKRFDFVFVGAMGTVYACECNFYSSSGSKLNETARSYKTLANESKDIDNFEFVWFTDGIGWNSAKNNLLETFEILENLFNLNDLENGVLSVLVDEKMYVNEMLKGN